MKTLMLILCGLLFLGATRNISARNAFRRQTGYPHGRPGYVVDHIRPLCAGGADAVANMQWQTVEAAKVKDVEEFALCAGIRAFVVRWTAVPK